MHLRTTLLTIAAGLTACEPSAGPFTQDLPEGALLQTNSEFVIFGLRTTGEADFRDVVLVNGGSAKVELHDIRIEGRDEEAFEIESVIPDFPNEREIPPREAAGIRVQFTSQGRNVNVASLTIESNAANANVLEIELVGPGANDPVPAEPDLHVFRGVEAIKQRPGYAVPVALARYFNLGGDTLEVSGYELTDAVGFQLLPGTPIPSIACAPDGVCLPDAGGAVGCCELACRGSCNGGSWDGQVCEGPCPGNTVGDPNVECSEMTCDPVRLVSGTYQMVPVAFANPSGSGPYDLDIIVSSNDPDQPRRLINIVGDLSAQ